MRHALNHPLLLKFIYARYPMAESWRVCFREGEQWKRLKWEEKNGLPEKKTPPRNQSQREPTLTKAPVQLCTARHSPADKHRWRWLIVACSSQGMRELIITAIIPQNSAAQLSTAWEESNAAKGQGNPTDQQCDWMACLILGDFPLDSSPHMATEIISMGWRWSCVLSVTSRLHLRLLLLHSTKFSIQSCAKGRLQVFGDT